MLGPQPGPQGRGADCGGVGAERRQRPSPERLAPRGASAEIALPPPPDSGTPSHHSQLVEEGGSKPRDAKATGRLQGKCPA